MKKYILILALGVFSFVNAQNARGFKIGYFDMNHILKSVPEFAEANNQLELRAQTWKKEIDDRQAQINLLVEELKTERVLLTKELIEEKEDEITFLQKELSDYQQKRFGPTGDLYTQKAVLVKPIQDQVFTIVSDIAERRNYDLIYDMSSASGGLVVANRRYDMNDEIIRLITREANREQAARKRMSKEEELAEHDKEFDPDLREREEERQAKIDERQQKVEDRRAEQEQKRQERFEERQAKIDERNQKSENEETATDDKPKRPTREEREAQIEQRKQEIQEQREQRQREIEQKREERRKELEEKRNNRNQNQNQESSSDDENKEE